MKTSNFFIALVLIFIFNLSCKKKEKSILKQTQEYCADNIIFSCNQIPQGDIFFKGKVNGNDFCISYTIDDYWYRNTIGIESTSSTFTPNLNPNSPVNSTNLSFVLSPPIYDNVVGISKDFQPSIRIRTPSIKSDSILTTMSFFLDEFVKEENLTLRDSKIDKFQGWYFGISWSCVFIPGYEHYKKKDELYVPKVDSHLSPTTGRQGDNTFFKIKEVNLDRDGNISTYYITFEIECDLYFHNGDYYGRLDDGEFKTKIIIEN